MAITGHHPQIIGPTVVSRADELRVNHLATELLLRRPEDVAERANLTSFAQAQRGIGIFYFYLRRAAVIRRLCGGRSAAATAAAVASATRTTAVPITPAVAAAVPTSVAAAVPSPITPAVAAALPTAVLSKSGARPNTGNDFAGDEGDDERQRERRSSVSDLSVAIARNHSEPLRSASYAKLAPSAARYLAGTAWRCSITLSAKRPVSSCK